MSAPKVLNTTAYFVREGVSGSAAETKPTFSSTYSLGVVTGHSHTPTVDKYVHRKCVGGTWCDSDVLPIGETETFTLTLTEVGEDVFKMIRLANPTLAAGAANYTPGSNLITKGWLQVQIRDQANNLIDVIDRWCELWIDSQDFGGQSAITVTVNGRKLYSTKTQGSWTNIP